MAARIGTSRGSADARAKQRQTREKVNQFVLPWVLVACAVWVALLVVQAELPAVKAVAKELKREPKPESVEPTTLGQTRTIWWTLAVIAVVTLAGGGLLLLRRAGN